MANQLYRKGKEKILQGQIAWELDDIKCVLVDTGVYTPDLLNDEYLSDIPYAARVATSPRMTGMSAFNGIADADDVTINSVSGSTFELVVVFKDTANELTSPLIIYIDETADITLPVVPTGAPVIIRWPSTANKIFRL